MTKAPLPDWLLPLLACVPHDLVTVEQGGKHVKVFVGARLIAALPKGKKRTSEAGGERGALNARAAARRRLQEMGYAPAR